MTQRHIEVKEFTCDGFDAEGGHCGVRLIHEDVTGGRMRGSSCHRTGRATAAASPSRARR
jgi:hypothetical protein